MERLIAGFKQEISFSDMNTVMTRYVGGDWCHRFNKIGLRVFVVNKPILFMYKVLAVSDWDHTNCEKCSKVHSLEGELFCL